MLISTVVFLFFLFLVYALFLLATRKADDRQERLQRRVAEALQSSHSSDDPVQISRVDSIGGSPTINRLLSSFEFIRSFDRMIRQADMDITVSRLLAFCLAACVLAELAAYTLLNSVMAVLFAILGGILPLLYIAHKRKKRLIKFNSQLPDSLDLLGRSLAVGHAFSESLNQVASEMPDPIAKEFRITFDEQKLGLTTKAALDRLAERVPLLDLRLCITAMHIQRETGGNLAEILEKVAYTIRERFRIMGDLKTLTTSSRLSAWILCGLPIFVALGVTYLNPDYMSVLWKDPRGHYLIAAAVILQITGMLIVRKILDIKI